GRHYKKLTPWVAAHRKALSDFLTDFWEFYDELLTYRDHPTPAARVRLAAAFDKLCATSTDYWALNDRIAKTRAKKAALLLVLDHPEIPLHNNPAELGATPAGAQTRCQLRAAHSRRHQSMGYLHEPGGYGAQIGR